MHLYQSKKAISKREQLNRPFYLFDSKKFYKIYLNNFRLLMGDRKMLRRIAIIFGALAVIGCAGGGGDGDGDAEIKTVVYERQIDGSYVFSTNDAQYADPDGATFSAYQVTGAPSGAFEYCVDMVKYTGDRDGGYGLVFQREDAQNYWVFKIDVFGNYYLSKVLGGQEYAKLTPHWKTATALHQGYGTTNRIEIAYERNRC